MKIARKYFLATFTDFKFEILEENGQLYRIMAPNLTKHPSNTLIKMIQKKGPNVTFRDVTDVAF